MKLILVFVLTTALALSAKGFTQDTLYQQKLIRQLVSKQPFVVKGGVIKFTQDSVIFDCKKKNDIFSLAFSYNDIASVRRYSNMWTLPLFLILGTVIYDHGFKIKMKNGNQHVFLTFKRKKIVEIIRSKIVN